MDDTAALTCRDTTYLVCGARDEALTPAQVRALERHIAGCAACTVAARQFAALFGQLDVLFGRNVDNND